MIYLKIENKVGKFYKDGIYVTIEKMANDDLWRLANLAIKQNDFQMDEYVESLLPNKAHQIIYKHVYELLASLQGRKEQYENESELMYKTAYDAYKQ
ncbi:hypothetical protein [Leyella stercorea]|jgi:hypothetical protein|uniref:hypothetical protein n=1 Tax=Leyella stercorea TaxID=363265 RepID=UPI002665AFEB|nr:hypothetical protein [Leyella stercorea]